MLGFRLPESGLPWRAGAALAVFLLLGIVIAAVLAHRNNPLAFLKSNLHSLREDLDELKGGQPELLSEVAEMVTESIDGAQ